MCECTDWSTREGECVCFQRFPLSCSTSQSDSSSNSRLLCSLLNCGENPPGKRSDPHTLTHGVTATCDERSHAPGLHNKTETGKWRKMSKKRGQEGEKETPGGAFPCLQRRAGLLEFLTSRQLSRGLLCSKVTVLTRPTHCRLCSRVRVCVHVRELCNSFVRFIRTAAACQIDAQAL
ncbi:hypothetical protein XENORESO_012629 [Xenotaenia resolanae]|uniref:Uncharacterized protein n=1 Tax=Xenotaenia resolanae TaxID=208358 RepID=A0ABV0X4U0_9TELE